MEFTGLNVFYSHKSEKNLVKEIQRKKSDHFCYKFIEEFNFGF
jgi:hypothetical protein